MISGFIGIYYVSDYQLKNSSIRLNKIIGMTFQNDSNDFSFSLG
jgi:hypothetical protein